MYGNFRRRWVQVCVPFDFEQSNASTMIEESIEEVWDIIRREEYEYDQSRRKIW